MNQSAERHLTKAEGYFAKGEAFYRKAAEEIVAAKEADYTLTNAQVGEWFGKSKTWVSNLVSWITSDPPEGTLPDWKRGSHATEAEIQTGAKKLLAEAPLEQVEQIVASLPKERVRAIGAAAGNAYLGAKQKDAEDEANMTPAQRKAREASVAAVGRSARGMVAGFATLGIVGHIEQATEELAELNADSSVTPEMAEQIDRVLALFLVELEVAKGLAGIEGGIV